MLDMYLYTYIYILDTRFAAFNINNKPNSDQINHFWAFYEFYIDSRIFRCGSSPMNNFV